MTDDAMDLVQGYHYSLPHLTQFLAELDFVDIPSLPLKMKQTRQLITKWAKAHLSDAQRTFTPAMLLSDPAVTTGWHTAVTGRMVTGQAGAFGPDQDLSGLRHFRMVFAGGFNSIDQVTARFQGLTGMVDTALADAFGANDFANSAHATRWARALCPSDEYDEYVALDDAPSYLAVLTQGGSAAEGSIFRHRFEASWRDAYPNICKALPAAESGAEAYKMCGTLAVRYKLGTPFSEDIARALDMVLARVLTENDTADLKTKTNNERLAVLANVSVDSSKSVSSGAPGSAQVTGGDQLHMMYSDASFDKLTKKLEVMAVPGYDSHAVLTLMLRDEHPFGLLWAVASKRITHPVWSQFTSVQTEACARETLLKLVAVDTSGVKQPSWSIPFADNLARKMCVGIHTMGDGGQKSIHYYKDFLKFCIEKREGFHMLAHFASYENQKCEAIFLDPTLMRYAYEPMAILFEFIGVMGKSVTSFRAFWQGFIDRATKLNSLPPKLAMVVALKSKLIEAGRLVFACSAEDHHAMMAMAYGVVKRPAGFLRVGSKGYVMIGEFDTMLKELMIDFERAKYSMGRMPGNPGTSSVFSDLMGASDSSTHSTDTSTAMVVRGGKKRDATVAGLDNDREWTEFDPSVTGAAALRHGVWFDKTGFAMGWTYMVLAPGTSASLTSKCPGPMAKSKHGWKRDQWHIGGCDCEKGHPRAEGVSEDKLIEKPITKEYRAKMTCLVEPSANAEKSPPNAKDGDEKPKGKGKGKGKGSAKGSKGKGGRRGGRGDSDFQRQW